MFSNLSIQLSRLMHNISAKNYLSENKIESILIEIKKILLEADVAFPVTEHFISQVKTKILEKKTNYKLILLKQELLKIMRIELLNTLGERNNTLNLSVQPPAVILIIGPQGSGKTTSIGKIGKFLIRKFKKKVMAVSTDIYRPAAITQLESITNAAKIDFFLSEKTQKPCDIASLALHQAKLKFYDVLLVDTPGSLHTNNTIISEIKTVYAAISPIEILLVVDAMTGQEASSIAKAFDQYFPLTGIILTKVDGDARGGAAISIGYLTGKPIKFIGTGEKINSLELFCPELLVSRVLNLQNIHSVSKNIDCTTNHLQLNRASNIKQDNSFNLIDLLEYIKQIRNIGGIKHILNKLPIVGKLPSSLTSHIDDKALFRIETIINSMTIEERFKPNIIKGSRKRRIAAGSGMQIQDVNQLLKHFKDMQQLMKKNKKNNIPKMILNIKNIMSLSIFK